MADALGMAAQLARNAVRFGWYSTVNWLLSRATPRLGTRPRYTPQLPVPSRAELMADLRMLFLTDAAAVREGLYPPAEPTESFADHLLSLRAMLAGLSTMMSRRAADDSTSAAALPGARSATRLLPAGLPLPVWRVLE